MKPPGLFYLVIILSLLIVVISSCKNQLVEQQMEEANTSYSIQPVDIKHVKVTDQFWLPVIKRVQQKTIEYALQKCKEEGRFDNFLIAGGQLDGPVRGVMPFDDSDVYKIIEGASNSLLSAPDPQLEILLDSLIGIIETGQESDGYLTTWRTINPAKPPASWVKVESGKRWESLGASHELYNAGHMYEAAAVHYQATGKRNFLNLALKNADLMVSTFGEAEGKIQAVPGHQIIETGLIKLYQITGKEAYLQLAKYFLDHRGIASHHQLFGSYSQDHLPVVQQEEVVGHAVRAVYMYAGMTDIAALQKDSLYRKAVEKLWENMVNKKIYITGGLGARHEGESFGDNYELPNLTAYSETCAAIGSVYWNSRLFKLTGEVKYLDVIERTLYNGLLAGISLDGTHFFYPNALESDGTYHFNQGACTRKEWFDCSCCPTNLIRFIPALPGLIYAKQKDTVYVNLYVSNTAGIDLNSNRVTLSQITGYPWNGQVKISVDTDQFTAITLKLRVPGWARNQVLPGKLYQYASGSSPIPTLTLNGKPLEMAIENGYFVITRAWKATDELVMDLPMKVQKVFADPKVKDDQDKLALEYGPLVYAIEAVDNPDGFDDIKISADQTFDVLRQDDLLGGVNILKWEDGSNIYKAIPYYAWSNRGVGKMKVWIPKN